MHAKVAASQSFPLPIASFADLLTASWPRPACQHSSTASRNGARGGRRHTRPANRSPRHQIALSPGAGPTTGLLQTKGEKKRKKKKKENPDSPRPEAESRCKRKDRSLFVSSPPFRVNHRHLLFRRQVA